MMNKKFFILIIVALFFSVLSALSASSAFARINRNTVQRAFSRIAEADNFPKLPINFENTPEANAWIAFKDEDNYSVHVTTGLMEILQSEEEIAGILGHELGHIQCGHYAQDVLLDIGRTMRGVGKGTADTLSQAVTDVDMKLKESHFSREQETQADEYGVKILVKAGYSAWGVYRAMRRFNDADDNNTGGFDSHPATAVRIQHLAELARKFEPTNSTNNENKETKGRKKNDKQHIDAELSDIAEQLLRAGSNSN